MTGHTDGLDETLLAQMPNVGRSIVRCGVVVVTKLTRRHYSERSDSGQGASFGAAQRIVAIALANDLSVWSSRKIYVKHERVTRIIAVSISLS